MTRHRQAIAILGAACRFPAADSLDEVATMLFAGRDAVREDIPLRRWPSQRLLHPRKRVPAHTYSLTAALIDNVAAFDPDLTGMSVREANQVDPQQMLLLELTHEALEDAGIPTSEVAGGRVGVFVGVSFCDHLNVRSADLATADGYFVTGSATSVVANRISHAFDFHGPSLTADTACSSSLVVLDMARHALLRGEIDTAIVGASNILLDPRTFVGFAQAMMLSPSGRCRPFSAQADGFMRAEGAGVLILRRQDRVSEYDRPLAWVLATGVNSDGTTVGLAMPNGKAQAALVEQTYAEAGVIPDEIDYFEAHGTGTPVGDPIESDAIGRSVAMRRTARLLVGSSKSSFGHLETASGMVGLFSAMAVLRHRRTPRLAHFEAPNPAIDFDALNIAPCTESVPLKPDGTLVVSVNSFGFGGTNGHAVLSNAPSLPPRRAKKIAPAASKGRLPPLLLSARTASALPDVARCWAAALSGPDDAKTPEIVRGAARARAHYAHRMVVRGGSGAELSEQIDAWLTDTKTARVKSGEAAQGTVAFVFSGNGSQWPGMAKLALRHNADFRTAIRRLDRSMRSRLGWSIEAELRAADPDRLRATNVAQPLLFAIQYALVESLAAWGIRPSAAIGHSVGEIAAAWCAGAISLETAIEVVICRSELQYRTHGKGRMAVCAIDTEGAERMISDLGIELDIAAHNAPRSLTLTGLESDLQRFGARAAADGLFFKDLDLDYAFHSRLLEPMRKDMLVRLSGIAGQTPRIAFYSTVASETEGAPAFDASYWWRNLRDPVRFSDAVVKLAQTDVGLAIEIGPHPVLLSSLAPLREDRGRLRHIVGSLSRNQLSGDPVEALIDRCHCLGASIATSPRYDGPRRTRGLPYYPYQRRTFGVTPTTENFAPFAVAAPHPLLGFPESRDGLEWRALIDLDTFPWLADHTVDGEVFMPASAMIDIALAAALVREPKAEALEILNLEIFRPLLLEHETTREVRLHIEAERNRFELASRPHLQDVPWTVHAVGRVSAVPPGPERRVEMPRGLGEPISVAALYAHGRTLGLDYGPGFRLAETVTLYSDTLASVVFAAPDTVFEARAAAGIVADPAWVDAVFHPLLAMPISRFEKHLPRRFGRIRVAVRQGVAPAFGVVTVRREGPNAAEGHILIADAEGRLLIEMADSWFVRGAPPLDNDTPSFWTTAQMPLRPAASAAPTPVLPAAYDDAQETALLLDAAILGGVAAALAGLDVGDEIDPDALAAEGRIEPRGRNLLVRLLDALTAVELATRTGHGWKLRAGDDIREGWADIWASLQMELPDAAAEIALVGAGLGRLTDALAGRLAADFQPESLIGQALADGPDGRELIDRLAEAAAAAVRRVPVGRRIAVLDIGACAGLVADCLARVLSDDGLPLPAGLHIVVAGSSIEHADRARAALARLPGRSLVWTPDVPMPATLLAQRFDLVLVSHPFALRLAPAALMGVLAPILAAGAQIVFAEPTPAPMWPLLLPDQHLPSSAAIWNEAAARHGIPIHSTVQSRGRVWDRCLYFANLPVRPAAAPQPTNPVLIATAGDEVLGFRLADRLRQNGGSVRVVDAAILIEAALAHRGDMVLLAGDPSDPVPVLTILARLSAALQEDTIDRLIVVTRGENAGAMVAQAIESVVRVFGNESQAVLWRTLRLSLRLDSDAMLAAICDALVAQDTETEQRVSDSNTTAPRIRSYVPGLTAGQPARLAIAHRGRVDGLAWTAFTPPEPGPGEVSIEVDAAGLNFRDLMWTMGLLPDEALLDGFAGPTLGLECAGRVAAVGDGVTRIAVGDRVMALAPAALASHAITKESACVCLPEGLSAEAATTIPVAFMTVVHALGSLARLRAGETVLIHGAAGGVGLAAIQYARHVGARIIATAGSEMKREYVRLLGADAVLDSRSIAFADEVRRLTDGRGVDVVLNSLSGRAMERSLAAIAPLGRFVELGKRDFFADTAIGLRPMWRNVAYFGVDVDSLAHHRPAAMADLLGEISALLEQGAIGPLPYRAVAFGQATDAFRQMRDGGHIGKLVLSRARGEALVRAAAVPYAADPSGTYLVTGGLAGFGLATAHWLVSRGVRHLALLSRRGATTPGADATIEAFAAAGCIAVPYACDIANRAQLSETLHLIRATCPPIMGVVHAAMVLRDGMLATMDEDAFRAVLEPKYRGAIWLDELTADDPLTLFLAYSSVSTLLANPGQANYVAANAGLEALIERRRAQGRSGHAVAWGPIADTGILAREGSTAEIVVRRLGSSLLKSSAALECLDRILCDGPSMVAVAIVRWSDARNALRGISTARFADVAGQRGEATSGPLDVREAAMLLPYAEALTLVQGMLVETMSGALRLPPDSLSGATRMSEIGIDSLLGVELGLAIEERFKVAIGRAALAEQATVGHLAAAVLRALGSVEPEEAFLADMVMQYEGAEPELRDAAE